MEVNFYMPNFFGELTLNEQGSCMEIILIRRENNIYFSFCRNVAESWGLWYHHHRHLWHISAWKISFVYSSKRSTDVGTKENRFFENEFHDSTDRH